jgi:hypothetical protein
MYVSRPLSELPHTPADANHITVRQSRNEVAVISRHALGGPMQAAFSAGAICSRATAADLIILPKRRAGRPAFKGRMAPFSAGPNKTAEKLLCSSHQAPCWQPNHAAVRAIRLGLVWAVSRYSSLNSIYQTNQGLRSWSLRSALRCAFLSARPAPSSSGQQMRG